MDLVLVLVLELDLVLVLDLVLDLENEPDRLSHKDGVSALPLGIDDRFFRVR